MINILEEIHIDIHFIRRLEDGLYNNVLCGILFKIQQNLELINERMNQLNTILESKVLGSQHIHIKPVDGVGFEPTKADTTDLQSASFDRSETHPK